MVVQLESRQDADEVASLNSTLRRLCVQDMSTDETIDVIYQSDEFSSALVHHNIVFAIAGTNTPCICCSWYVVQIVKVSIL
jgi:hypothetical protein